jgi:hypothetical protein
LPHLRQADRVGAPNGTRRVAQPAAAWASATLSPARRAARGLTWEDVVALAADLPGIQPSTSYGTPAIKVKGAMLVRLREMPRRS